VVRAVKNRKGNGKCFKVAGSPAACESTACSNVYFAEPVGASLNWFLHVVSSWCCQACLCLVSCVRARREDIVLSRSVWLLRVVELYVLWSYTYWRSWLMLYMAIAYPYARGFDSECCSICVVVFRLVLLLSCRCCISGGRVQSSLMFYITTACCGMGDRCCKFGMHSTGCGFCCGDGIGPAL
jgi:hypothetical protein